MDSALSLAAKGFLTFGNSTLIVPFLIIGFLLEKNGIIKNFEQGSIVWTNVCLLILFTMIFNTLLKSLFLVPLNPALGKEGFAFPSGHMQVSVVFYGWVFWAYPYRGGLGLILLILTGLGYGLIQQGYHTLEDVVAAVAIGTLTVYGAVKITRLSFIQKNPVWLGIFLIPLAGLMMGAIHYRIGIPLHIILTFMGLMGITVGWFCCCRFSSRENS